jgi:hypothetical protein
MSDKRAQFFLLAAVVCLVLAPVAHDDFRTLTIGVGVLYAVLATASWLDHRGRR